MYWTLFNKKCWLTDWLTLTSIYLLNLWIVIFSNHTCTYSTSKRTSKHHSSSPTQQNHERCNINIILLIPIPSNWYPSAIVPLVLSLMSFMMNYPMCTRHIIVISNPLVKISLFQSMQSMLMAWLTNCWICGLSLFPTHTSKHHTSSPTQKKTWAL